MHEETTLFEVDASSENHEKPNSDKPRRGRKADLDRGRVVSLWLDEDTVQKLEQLRTRHEPNISASECIRRLIIQEFTGRDNYFDEEVKLFD